MTVVLASILIAIALSVPVATLWLEGKSRVVRALSPVVVCYIVGMLFGNQPWVDFSNDVALGTCSVAVALAIPLLLFSVNIIAWLRLAKSTVISFFFCMLSVMVVSATVHYFMNAQVESSPQIAGMLVGVYTGGTPNMAAIASALQVDSETYIVMNAADMMASFAYLFFILAIAPKVLSRLSPAFKASVSAGEDREDGAPGKNESQSTVQGVPPFKVIVISLVLTGVIVALAVGAGMLVAGDGKLISKDSRDAVTILLITSVAIFASSFQEVRKLPGTQDMGQFLLLVFCVAMGFTTDFSKLFSGSPTVFIYTALVLWGSVLLHFLLAILARIDRDTIIITSSAAIFGPHMVGPVAVALKNKEILVSGLASGLVGYAVGNYLGVGLA